MSFNPEEFNEILEAYKIGNLQDIQDLIKSSDPETVATAEKYLGISLSDFTIIGKGQGKQKEELKEYQKKYGKIHTKKGYRTKKLQAKTLQEKRLWKIAQSWGLGMRRKIKAQKIRIRKKNNQIKKLTSLKRQHKTLLQSASRSGISLPYVPRRIGGRKGAHKRPSTHIRNIERENKLLKLSISKAGKAPRIGKLKGKLGVDWVWAKTKK